MTTLSLLRQISTQSSYYSSRAELLAYEKDKEATTPIYVVVWDQLSLLQRQWDFISPHFWNRHLTYLPLAGMAGHLIASYLPSSFSNLTHLYLQGERALLSQASKIIKVAYLVSYVAMTFLGFTLPGTIGLLTSALIELKQKGFVSQAIEKNLDRILFWISLIGRGILPATFAQRAMDIFYLALALETFVLSSPYFKSLFPWFFNHLFLLRDTHKVSKEKGLSSSTFSLLEKEDNFSVNRSSIYTEHLNEVLPLDLQTTLENTPAQDLFHSTEDFLRSENVLLTQEEKEGLSTLKSALIQGKIKDVTPPNFPLFQLLMKSIFLSILGDPDPEQKKIKIQEIAEIGNSCVEGWTRDLLFLHYPKTSDPRWAIHHELACLRTELIQEEFQKECRELGIKDVLGGGGNHNIHTSNAVHALVWSEFRTYQGEVTRELQCLSFTVSFILYLMQRLTSYLGTEDSFLAKSFHRYEDPSLLVDRIFESIKPTYKIENYKVGNKGIATQFRKIPWQAIAVWLKEISKKFPYIPIENPNPSNPWISTNEVEAPYLTKQAVRLLLWDLGILELKSISRFSKP